MSAFRMHKLSFSCWCIEMAIVMWMSYMLTRKINVNRVVERLTTCQAAESKQAEVALRKGVLFEFTKESGKSLLAVVQKAEGKKTWIAMDQFGNLHSVKPQQVTYVVPSEEDFRPADIASFIEKSENLEVVFLLSYTQFLLYSLLKSSKEIR
jgi:hypothetical protein